MPIIQIPKDRNIHFFLLVVIVEQLFSWIAGSLMAMYDPSLVLLESRQNRTLTYAFWVTVVFIPITETLLFQFGIIELLQKLKLRLFYSVVVSAIVFGLAHFYNIPYILSMVVVGFIFAYYYAALRHQGKWRAVLWVTAVHTMASLVTFFTNYVFQD